MQIYSDFQRGTVSVIFLKSEMPVPLWRYPLQAGWNLYPVYHNGFVPTYQKGIKGQYQLIVEKSWWHQLKSKLKRATRKTTPMTFNERVQRIKDIHRGWINNYRLASIQDRLKLDGWLRNRLRYCIWHYWKKRERKRKNLSGLESITAMPFGGAGADGEAGRLPRAPS
jgi:RNA-directed DNA polymerase